jgi:Ca-activated chloride channel family protein
MYPDRLSVVKGLLLVGLLACMWNVLPSHAQDLYGQASQTHAGLVAERERQVPFHVLIILDASDSMNEVLNGRPKIQMAKEVVLKTIRALPPDTRVGLRVYGHRLGRSGFQFSGPFGSFSTGGDMCRQTQLLVPPGLHNRPWIATQLLNIQAKGKTPITYSLQEAINHDFQGVTGKKTIILVSDGRETCSHNPCDLAVDMVRAGIDVKINTIGLGIRDKLASDQLRCIASATRGHYYSANTTADLAKSLSDSVQVETQVKARITP